MKATTEERDMLMEEIERLRASRDRLEREHLEHARVGVKLKEVGDKPGDWMEVPQNLANGVHFALSYGTLLTVAFLAHQSPHLKAFLIGWEVFLLLFVLGKEYWYDLKYETGETMWTSTLDCLGWLAGAVVCWGVLGIAYWRHLWP
jgi:hypothetical protein